MRICVTGVVFLLYLICGAIGGELVELVAAPHRVTATGEDFYFVSVMGMPLGMLVGSVIGILLGVAVAFHVWRLLGRRSREGND
jgi:hypothetical protein